MKHILDRKRYKLIKEDSGPLGNDINWGDSLVGRLLFSIFRAVQLGVDKGKISWYLGKLEDVLKNPLSESFKDDENWKNGVRVIKNGAANDTLINTIEENPEELGKLLEDWKEDMGEDWLKSLLEGLDPELLAIIEAIMQNGKGSVDAKEGADPKIYSVMISNLTHLKAVIDNVNSVKLEGSPFEKPAVRKYYNFQGKKGNGVCFVLSQTDEGSVYAAIWKRDNSPKLGEWLYSTQGAYISAKNLLKEIPVDKLAVNKIRPYTKPTQKDINLHSARKSRVNAGGDGDVEVSVESVSYEELYERVFGEKEAPAEVKGNESHLTEALNKIKKSLMIMISPKEKGIGVDSKFIGDILSQSKTPEGKDAIKNLYREIQRFLTGDKSHELTVEPLYKESVDIIKDKNKVIVVAEKIARFTKRSLQFEGQNLYGGMGAFGKSLELYNTTLNQIVKPKTNESMIFESDEVTKEEGKIGGWLSKFIGIKVGDEALAKVKIKGEGNTVNIYVNGKEVSDVSQLAGDNKENVQKAVDDLTSEYSDAVDQHSKDYVLDGIEIVRIFNKVNRVMVRGRVPSVRTGGTISQMKSNEWEMITKDAEGDSPDPQSGAGPVRNRRLFQQWNDGVLELIKKYDAVLKNAKVLDKDGNPITPPYPVSKFMNDALNDMKLFRSMSGRGEGGYQWQYLESHLGLTQADLKKAGLVSGGDSEFKDEEKPRATKGDKNIPEVTVKTTKFAPFEKDNFRDGCFYKIKLKPGSKFAGNEKVDSLYFLCMKESNGKVLFKISLSDAFAKPYYHTYKPQTNAGVSKIVYKSVLNLREVGEDSKIIGKCKSVKDGKEYEYKIGVRSVEILVDENETPVNRKEVIGLKVNPEYDAGINPTKDVSDTQISGRVSESQIFRKYSDIIKS